MARPAGSRLSRRRLGLGLLAGAVVLGVAGAVGAQVPAQPPARPTPADTARPGTPPTPVPPTAPQPDVPRAPGDTLPRPRSPGDTLSRPAPADTARVRKDSIKAPFARAEFPVDLEAGPAYRWTRDQLFATGAYSVADLLARIPGVTDFRSGWLASAQVAVYQGDAQRVRVFRDGVELDPVNPRAGGTFDLVDVQIWQLDELAIERVPGELRVYMRTWTVRNTTPYTRADIYTGDENTNFYRGFYGIRFGSGWGFQVAAQQFGTGANARRGGGGDMLAPLVRLGWAQKKISADLTYTRVGRTRQPTLDFVTLQPVMPREETIANELTLRVGYGDPQRGAWAQVMANALDFTLRGEAGLTTTPGTSATDTTLSRTQLLAAVGYARGGGSVSLTNRMRHFEGRTFQAPELRASFDRRVVAASLRAERTGHDSTTRLDVGGRLSPLPWIAIGGGVSRATRDDDAGDQTGTDLRGELAVRLGRLWFAGGRLRRDATLLPSPRVFGITMDTSTFAEGRAAGTTGSVRGPIWRGLSMDAQGVVWDDAGLYRPRYQARAELSYANTFPERFPRGDFGLKVSLIDEYRTETFVPASATDVTRIPPFNQLSGLLEIRIMEAVLTYQIRNALVRRYENVPRVLMPGPVSFYGVRWDFSN